MTLPVSTGFWPIWRSSPWSRWSLPRLLLLAVSLRAGGGGGQASYHIVLNCSPSAFVEYARFATEGTGATECLGRIGRNGQRFCIIKGCDTKHQGGKFEAPPNHLFIKSSDATKIPVGQMAEFLSLSKPVDEWVDVFSVLESMEEDEVSLGEVDRKLISWSSWIRRKPIGLQPKARHCPNQHFWSDKTWKIFWRRCQTRLPRRRACSGVTRCWRILLVQCKYLVGL